LVWIIFATIQDIRKREVADWLNFSLIIFAIGFRFFYSLFSEEGFAFFYQGLIGLGIFLILGNLLYYGKMFAGGDAKLFISLGAILPFSLIFSENLRIFVLFFLIFLFAGAIYSLSASIFLSIKNLKKFKKEFSKQIQKRKKILYAVLFLGLVIMAFGFSETIFFVIGILVFIFPYFYVYVKTVDEACMVKRINTKKLQEGDWLYRDLKIGRKKIKANWNGLTKKDIKLIKKHNKFILIRQGIPFTPVFFVSFVILFYLWKTGLWKLIGLGNSFW